MIFDRWFRFHDYMLKKKIKKELEKKENLVMNKKTIYNVFFKNWKVNKEIIDKLEYYKAKKLYKQIEKDFS